MRIRIDEFNLDRARSYSTDAVHPFNPHPFFWDQPFLPFQVLAASDTPDCDWFSENYK